MVPKFRGDSDDWLDDQKSKVNLKKSPGAKPKKAASSTSSTLPWEKANATVVEIFPNQCRVRFDSNQVDLLCSYRRAKIAGKLESEARERSPVAVGDRVFAIQIGASSGVIEGICQRKNSLSRVAPGKEDSTISHVLAANIDLVVIVASAHEPEFSPGLVDRFLVAASSEGIPVLLCVTKVDLLRLNEAKPWEIYKNLGIDSVEVSSKEEVGLSILSQKIQQKTAVLCGHSGVGKTSLFRLLLKSEVGKVSEVSEWSGKGRHTTTGAVLLEGPNGSRWIDTPGIREFGLRQIRPEELSRFFPEFNDLECTQNHCLHLEEISCSARQLPRYASYRRIYESLTESDSQD
jgi:ribosome biogenesis GTPase / thiamine phosphate phosphatase